MGLLVAGVVAAVVFAVGYHFFPGYVGEPGAATDTSGATSAGGPPPDNSVAGKSPTVPAAGLPDAGAVAGAGGRTALPVHRAAGGHAAGVPDAAPARGDDGDGTGRDRLGPDQKDQKDQERAYKDVAYEAWRKNLPDLSVAGGKASLIVPIKGSAAGSSFQVTNTRPRTVVVALPAAASLITMRLYRIGHDGFRQVWIDQAEQNAQPKDGSHLKIVLNDPVDPVVEISDDYVRVTVRLPADPGAPAGDRAAAPPSGGPSAKAPTGTPDAASLD